jgi:hypothetical protein
MPGVFPDYPAPVVRNAGADRELILMRWGMPPPPRTGGPPVTNIRNSSSPHWRAWLKPENRCLVPFNSFAEYTPEPNPETKKKDVVWFALNEDRPLAAFAGIWTEYRGDRGTKSKPIPGPHLVYGFLTTAPNAVVEPIHLKAMPVNSLFTHCRCFLTFEAEVSAAEVPYAYRRLKGAFSGMTLVVLRMVEDLSVQWTRNIEAIRNGSHNFDLKVHLETMP